MHPETEKNVRAYLIFKSAFLRQHPYCELVAECFAPAVQIHHVKGHGHRGELLCDERYTRAACLKHHRWIHDNAKAARKSGILGF